MKSIISRVLAVVFAIALSGCASATKPIVSVPTAQSVAGFVQPLTQAVVPLVLDKNPGYADALSIVADAIPVIYGSGNLTPEGITAALTALNAKAALSLSPEAIGVLANGLSIAVSQYQVSYGVKVASATDPGVQLIVTAFATGLKDGVAVWKTAHAAG